MLVRRRMAHHGTIVCGSPELAVDVQAVAGPMGLQVATPVAERPFEAALRLPTADAPVGVASTETPPNALLPALADRGSAALRVALLRPRGPSHHLLSDLGMPTVDHLPALLSLIALAWTGAPGPQNASLKALSALDRRRLDGAGNSGAGDRKAGAFRRTDHGLVQFEAPSGRSAVVGFPWDCAHALHALREAAPSARPSVPRVEDVDHQAVLDVILGPRRVLSDPASKAALDPYDLPLPLEELCGSASRAAAEATRIGFPVRIALASPELRVSDHPDLAVDGVESAARVRDVFRQTMALARSRSPEARLLGVTVSAATTASALLRVHVQRLGDSLARAEVCFADAHGVAADDRTFMALPTSVEGMERSLRRLAGHAILLGHGPAERRHVVRAVGDVLLRLAAFVHEWPEEIEGVEVHPLAVLIGGDVEVREARVQVTDAFTRSLEQRPREARRT